MKKEMFVEAIKAIREEELLSNNFSTDIEKYTSSYVVLNSSPTKLFLLKLLQEEMEDDDDFIGWWIYEKADKQVIDGDKVYNLNTPEELYDFLIEVYN